ncbi:MAG: hypothetical protein A2541_00290 [Candidatus Taylorbacteria bacterium RIFOXYD2_FULL_36_9]|uniref:Uncharacterized protein n=1 Tax=Candidatus Taylorbacteria bacterium RIFOXYD2_FULL_36_9 TaxID=1802338 RepID=A0A1G2PFJ9_9BACT|nr:MAG: hypothetical protein A2541_00290 [Candidatus Taylorbacteria bacterium RIFOXYD2_FULL_36_9]
MKTYKNKQGGLIKMIIIIIIAIAILSYYGVDIKDFVTSPQVQKNFSFVWNLWLQYIWDPFLVVIKK